MATWSTKVSLYSCSYNCKLDDSLSTWNWGMSWVGIFSFAGCILIWTLPESPRWLVQDHQIAEAALSLRKLRRTNLINAELDEIERQEATVGTEDVSLYTMCISTRFHWPLLTSIALNVAQQFSGINTVRRNESIFI